MGLRGQDLNPCFLQGGDQALPLLRGLETERTSPVESGGDGVFRVDVHEHGVCVCECWKVRSLRIGVILSEEEVSTGHASKDLRCLSVLNVNTFGAFGRFRLLQPRSIRPPLRTALHDLLGPSRFTAQARPSQHL